MMNYTNTYNPYGIPQQQIPQQYQNQHSQFFKIIPISNENEINSIVADFNGTPLYFHNQSNNEIYIKQFDIKTGMTAIQAFRRVEKDEKGINPLEINLNAINDKLDVLQKTFEDYTKAKKAVVEEIENENKKGGKK